jgi:very-short-patch-repair endonuclease
LVNYIGSFKKIKLICPIHGEFEQSSDKHVKGHGCLFCKESKGEKEIRVYLENNKIKHLQQYVFNDCRDRYPLPFDFYLPNYNMCIEFDGRQHFEAVDRWGGLNGLLDQQKKDEIKNKYCLDNNIKLLRIAHNENIINKLKCHIL